MKILIVSLKAGNGHVKAAQAIEVAFKKYYLEFEVKNIDLLDFQEYSNDIKTMLMEMKKYKCIR